VQGGAAPGATGLGVSVGWLAGLVPLAAVVVVDPAGWYPFGPAKQTAVTVAVLVSISFAARSGSGWPRERLGRIWGLVWIGLLGWLALAALFGLDPIYAWIGTPERRLGWLGWALLAGSAWVGGTLCGAEVRRLCRAIVLAGAWCGAYCLVELWRQPVETSAVTSRLGGPFGSAAYLGAAICLTVPVAAGVAADAGEQAIWRRVAGFAFVSGAIGLVGSGTRAAWVALAITGVLVVAVRPSWRVVLAGLGVVFVAIAVVAPRLDEVTGRSDVGGAARLAEWEVAANVIAEHPLLGTGPEGYRIALSDGVDDDYERTYGRDVLPDRAHSALLDVAAIGGLPATVMYAALLVTAGWAAQRALRSGVALMVGLASAVVAYTLQQLLLFPLAEIDPVFWLLAGGLVAARPGAAAGPAAETASAPDAASGVGRRVIEVTCALLAVLVFVVGVLGVAADRSARTALRRPDGSDGAVAAAERATELRPDVLRYRLLASAVYADVQSVAGARAAVRAALDAADLSPRDPIARQRLAASRTELAQVTGSPVDLAAARAEWEDLVADDPHCLPCWLGLGSGRLLSDDLGGARTAWERALELSGSRDQRAANALATLGHVGGEG
jgi:O-antigen ligase